MLKTNGKSRSRSHLRFLSEGSLGRRARRGDSQAFAEIFRRYQQPLFAYCYSNLNNQDDALDAMQSTMVKALDSLPGEDREIKVKSWLFQVARNECIDMIRSRRETCDVSEQDIPASSEVEVEVANRDRLRSLLCDLGELPERQRNALLLRELNGFEFSEIGSVLGSSTSAAKQIVYEARTSLQVQAEGKSMSCVSAREAISERDGRMLRGRKIKAHINSCPECLAFREDIGERTADLRMLMPMIPAGALAAMLGSGGMVEVGGAVTGASGLATGSGLVGAAGMKVAATVAVVGTVGALGVVASGPGDKNSSDPLTVNSPTVADQIYADPGDQSIVFGEPERKADRGEDGSSNGRGTGAEGNSDPGARPGDASPGNDSSAADGGETGDASTGAGGSGGSGGSKGRGAIASHGAKPVSLPAAAQKGQEQAQASQNKVKPETVPPEKPSKDPAVASPTSKSTQSPSDGGKKQDSENSSK